MGDPYAIMITDKDYTGASYPFIYDKVLSDRLYAEYNAMLPKSKNSAELFKLVDCLDDNIGELSPEAAEYIASLDSPLAFISNLVPLDLTNGEISDEDADMLFDKIEQAALNANTDKIFKNMPDGNKTEGVKNIMAEKKIRTIAFQVDDPDFVAEYEARVKDSGLSVKNYFVSLIKADIAQNQAQKDNPVQADNVKEESHQLEQNTAPSQQIADDPAPINEPEQMADTDLRQEPDEPAEKISGSDIDGEEPQEQGQNDGDDQRQNTPPAPEPEEMMNLFVKIPKDQREALEYRKNETGETVGAVLNRLIDEYLTDPYKRFTAESLEETYKYYAENIKLCDTTASAKIPSKNNQELSEILAANGGSRNALMSTLVHMELYGQEQEQSQGMTM